MCAPPSSCPLLTIAFVAPFCGFVPPFTFDLLLARPVTRLKPHPLPVRSRSLTRFHPLTSSANRLEEQRELGEEEVQLLKDELALVRDHVQVRANTYSNNTEHGPRLGLYCRL